MTDALIELQQVHFHYGKIEVLSDLSFSVSAGRIFGLVGADGAGKSTLLKLLVGQLLPSSGNISVLGKNPSNPSLRDDLAYMPQGFGLYQDLSVQENLEFFADLHGLGRDTTQNRINDLLQRTGLNSFEDRRAGNLSGGMMQKLALSCALISEPKVMFLDEPTTGVDPLSRRAFWRLLDSVRAEGVGIIYATANMDEAERCDQVGMLENGMLTQQGTPVELVNRTNAQLLSVSGADIRRYRFQVRDLPGVEFLFPVGPRLNVWLQNQHSPEQFRESLSAISGDLSAETLTPTLHDTALRDLALSRHAENEHGID